MTRAAVVAGVVAPALGTATGMGRAEEAGYAKAVTCSACHGFGGNSRVDAVPILAGMAPAYFKKAIEDYAAGRRVSAEMEPFAKQVKLLGVDELAAFFAAAARAGRVATRPRRRRARPGGRRAVRVVPRRPGPGR